jgi:hypothetical protein
VDFYKYRFLFSLLIPLGIISSILGSGFQTYEILIFAFVILPVLELFLKADKFNLPKESEVKNLSFYIAFQIQIYW